jgi:2-succinyl-6-hydroxy-2,4-cyclohexadiene-1-carboxylate synthase
MVEYISEQRATFDAQASTPNVLLGYSMGARAALLHATRFPSAWDALILISPNPGIEDEAERAKRRALDAELADQIERDGLQAFLDYWKETPMIRSQKQIRAEWLAAMQQNRLKHTASGLANSLRYFGQGSVPNLWPELDKLTMPICLITGQQDIKYTEISQRILPTLRCPKSAHTIVDDASHMPHLEQAEASADVVKRFLKHLDHNATSDDYLASTPKN